MDLSQYFVSLAALVPLVVLITDFINKWINVEKGWIKQVVSWVISIVLCLAAMFLNWGMFAELKIGVTISYGVATGLVANGIFDIKIVQTILDFLLKFLKKE